MTKRTRVVVIVVFIALFLVVGGGITVFALEWSNREESVEKIENSEILDVLIMAENIKIFVDGEEIDEKMSDVKSCIEEMMSKSRLMPAFGVALDGEVKSAREQGVWVEFFYDKTYEFEGMPFDKLLIEVGRDYTGFNIMRNHDGQYEGRCYYVDLVNNNMSKLYELIVE